MDDATLALTEEVRHLDKNVRIRAALSLGKLSDADAMATLVGALKVEDDFFVRETITWALTRIGDPAVLPLIELMNDREAGVRHHAAHALSKMGDARAVPALLKALHDSDDLVVGKAVYALGHLGAVGAMPDIIALLEHPKLEVQSAVLTALERQGPAAVSGLVAVLGHPKERVRELAANALGAIADPRSAPDLARLLRDEVWKVRVAALMALNQLKGDEVTTMIAGARDDDDSRVRTVAAKLVDRRLT